MNDIYSFYRLINQYKIEIPIIQRDYAQGRNNSKAEDVRKSIVENMVNAVSNNEDSLFFDFIYGRIDGDTFIPFDGQQRLTTLFLFHKYIFEMCKRSGMCDKCLYCNGLESLKRFTYQTRQSSREFCEKMIIEDIIPESNVSVSTNVQDKSWFFADWEKDPTIMGMLTMLDQIHTIVNQVQRDFYKMSQRLTNACNCPITFHFVDMGEHKLSDSTYVKMNARGKSLTSFENFKASLEQYLENEHEKDILERFGGKIDGEWLDLFWDKKNDGGEESVPDDLILSFINRHFMNVWRLYVASKPKGELIEEEKKLNEKIINQMPFYPNNEQFISFNDIYKPILVKCGLEECLLPIFNIWDTLTEKKIDDKYDYNNLINNSQAVWQRVDNEEKVDSKKKWDVFKGDINNNRETYPSRIVFYAIMLYFKSENKYDENSFKQWMRVVWNIVENSTIDSPSTYDSALMLVKEMAAGSYNIYQWLLNNKINSRHAEEQVTEEIEKAKKILDDNMILREYEGSHLDLKGEKFKTWEDVIISAEKHAFFKGAIRFLFRNENGDVDWGCFETKYHNAQEYFDIQGVKDSYRSEAILLKAVLFHAEVYWKLIEPQKFVLDNESDTWKNNILTDKAWKSAVHQVLSGNLRIKKREHDCLLYQSLYDGNLVNYVSCKLKGSRIRWIHGHRAIYPPRYEGVMPDDEITNPPFYRNSILSKYYDTKTIYSSQKIEDCGMFWGWDINFEYNGSLFQWNRDNNIYILDGNKKCRKDVDKAENLTKENFIDKLDKLIKSIEQ